MNTEKESLKENNIVHPLYTKETDQHNSDVAKYVSLAVALFHIPLILLDLYRMFYDKELFAKPGFSGITLVHVIYFLIFTALYIASNFLIKENKIKEPDKNLKIYWRLFLYSTLTYAMLTSPLCHLMHGNTTTYLSLIHI